MTVFFDILSSNPLDRKFIVKAGTQVREFYDDGDGAFSPRDIYHTLESDIEIYSDRIVVDGVTYEPSRNPYNSDPYMMYGGGYLRELSDRIAVTYQWNKIVVTFVENNYPDRTYGLYERWDDELDRNVEELTAYLVYGYNVEDYEGNYIFSKTIKDDAWGFEILQEPPKYISNIEMEDTNYLIKSVGLADSNGSIMKTWRGTLAEYNALATKDDNTLYKITDDEPQVIADFTTLVNQVASHLAKKVDLPDNKGQDGIDYVVEWKEPTEADPTWYRVYKSGWVEQGGTVTAPSDSAYVVNLPKTMINSVYTVMITRDTGTSELGTGTVNGRWQIVYNRDITSFTTWGVYSGRATFMWEAKGQGANQ